MSLKQMMGVEAAKYIEGGMIVGSDTDSTIKFMVDEVGRHVKEEGLLIVGVTTSEETEKQALVLGTPLKGIDEAPHVDLTIDGVDEISADFQGIKGGGVILLFGKIVATYLKKRIQTVDKSKMADDLGTLLLPVEAAPYGGCQPVHSFKEKGYHPALRLSAIGKTLITDEGYHIIDLYLEKITDPRALGSHLDNLIDIVEHGLFLNMVSVVTVDYEDGPKTLYVPARQERVKKDCLYRKGNI